MAEANRDQPADAALVFRMGLHLGDLIVDGEDLYGDGVNVAARLEGEAPAGGILISRNVRDAVAGRVKATFEDMGGLSLKNIERSVRAFRVQWEPSDWQALATPELTVASATSPQVPLPLPDKPSIAVLPFQNMSSDPDQEYFADGIVEEIIAALSRVHWLFVIARNSTFTYKGRAVDIKQVGRDLGVRYVLEGSVRKAGERIRINGQLIDAANGTHLWADRFDGALEDVFDLQDRVTASVVGAIAPKLEFAEIERAKRKPTGSLTAYDFYLRGLANMHQDNTREATDKALQMLSHAMEIDHDFASALGLAARCYARRKANGWMVDRALERAEGERLARRASVLAKDDAVALCSAGFALAMLAGETENGAELIDRALAIDPNMARGWHYSGLVRLWLGQPEVALEHNSRAIRLSPLDPLIGQMQTCVGHVHFVEGRYEEASQWTGRAMRSRPNWLPSMILATASAALSGRSGDAQQLASRLRSLDPTFRISNLRERLPFSRPEYLAPYEEGLRRAGLPE